MSFRCVAADFPVGCKALAPEDKGILLKAWGAKVGQVFVQVPSEETPSSQSLAGRYLGPNPLKDPCGEMSAL
jgi:hypothetical protein